MPSSPGSRTLQPSPPPPPPYAAGDQPAAPPPGKKSVGDPPATLGAEEFGPVTPVSCRTLGSRFSSMQREVLELHYCSSAENGDSSAAGAVRTEAAGSRGAGGLRLRSIVVKPSSHRVSYTDASVGVRTFKPRFDEMREEYYAGAWSEKRGERRSGRPTVWGKSWAMIGWHS